MSPSSIKLMIFAADQIFKFTALLQQAKDYPDMTPEQAEELKVKTQTDAAAISDAWDAAGN